MSIKVESTTDSKEVVAAVMAEANPSPEVETVTPESAPEEIPAEVLENSDAQDETDESESESPDESADDKPKKNKLQKRMSKLTKQREDARKEADYWKQVALDKSNKTAAPEQSPEVKAQTDSTKRPAAEDFDTHELYVEALADWKVEEKLSKREAQTRETALKSEQETKLKTFLDKREAFAKGHDDFFERMTDINDIPMSLTVNESLLESENGPELLYELAKDPEEYKRICSLPAIAAARELGKFEARLSPAEQQAPETKTSKAPTPIRPVGSKSTGSGKKTIFDSSLSQAEYEALRREQIAKKA